MTLSTLQVHEVEHASQHQKTRATRPTTYFAAVILGILFGLLFSNLIPNNTKNNVAGTQQQQNHVSATLSISSIFCNSSSNVKINNNDNDAGLNISDDTSLPAAAQKEKFISCENQTERCGVLYHAFDVFRATNSSSSSSSSSLLSVPKFLWRAILSASSLRSTQYRQKEHKSRPRILLATNVPGIVLETAKIILKNNILLSKRIKSAVCPSVAGESSTPSPPVRWNAHLLFEKFSEENEKQLLQLLFSDLGMFVCSDAAGDFVSYLLWPFDEILVPETPRSFKFEMKADGLDLASFPRLADFDRLLYLDSDTIINKDIFEILDSIPPANANDHQQHNVDIAMVQEYNWHRDLSPFLYEPVLHSSSSSSSSAQHQWWVPHHPTAQKKPNNKKEPTPFGLKNHALYEIQYNTGVILLLLNSNDNHNDHHANTQLQRKRSRPITITITTTTKNHKDGTLQNFVSSWRRIHRSSSRCRNDKVLWDQCSLPLAIRASGVDGDKVRVVTLSDRFNFREALGYGCADDGVVYLPKKISDSFSQTGTTKKKKDRGEGHAQDSNDRSSSSSSSLASLLKERIKDGKVPNFDEIVIFHSFEVKSRQDEWIDAFLN